LGAADAMEAVKVPHANGNEGFMFRVPAKNTPQTVTVLVGVTNAQAEIVARLSDESAPPAVLRLTGGPAESVYAVEIPYRAAADGRHLLVTFTHTAKTGAIALKGIVLSEGARPGVPAGVTVTAQNTAVKIDAEPPAGETFDSWNVYYGLSPDNLDRSASAASMPFVIGGLTNLVKYYVAVAGVKDGAEGIPSAVLRVVPEEYPLSDEERAAVDLDAAIPVIMNGNDAENAKNWLQTVGAGSVYESAVSWSSSTNGQYPGIWDTGEIEFPVGRDMPTRITITSVYGAATVTKTVDVIVKAVDVRRGAYVLDTAVSVYTGGVYLTQEGSKDWIQFTQAVNGSNPQARKAGGRGFGIPRLAFTSPDHKRAGGLGLTYVYEAADAVQTDPAITDGYAVDMRGLGDYIEVDVAYSEKPQRASVYFGVWRSAVRADFVVNGAIVASETASQNGGGVTNFRAAFDFKLQNAGDTASIRLTLADDTNFGSHAGSLVYNALTLQELDAPLHNIPKVPVAVLPAASTASFNNGAVNLTGEGTFDWWQFPQDSETDYARKQSGFGLFGFKRNHDAVPSGERGRVTDTLISYSATDRDTNYPDVISKSGMQCRGAGNGFQFEIAASGSPRVLNVYTGNWNSIATTEYIVDGQTRYSNVTDNLGHGVYRHTIYIAPGETGLVRHTLASMTATGYGGVHGSTFVLAVTLGTDSAAGYGTKVPAERFAHKSAGVDPSIENCGLGGKNVGGIGAGSWLTYGIDVEAAGLYQLALEYAAQSATNPGLTILLDDKPIGSVTQITATGAGQTWAYRTVDVALPAGAHVLKLSYANAGTNLRSLNFKYLSDYVPETGVTLTRSGGALTAVFTIGNAAPSAADAQCVIAMYDGGGRLAKVETIPVSVGAETGTECSAVRLYDGAFAKAFIWDADTRIPLCDAAILP
jgi:hypothetical protein